MGEQKPPELLSGTLELLILKALARGKMRGHGISRTLKVTSKDVLQTV